MKIVILADAFPALGTGHLMRMIALAECCQVRGHEVIFTGHSTSDKLITRIRGEGFKFHEQSSPGDLKPRMDMIRLEQPEWVVLDGYHFGLDTQRAIRQAGPRLLVVDDYAHLPEYEADIILNQNPGAESIRYNAGPDPRYLLGPEYILLRREFLDFRGLPRSYPERARNILVTMGGADADNITLKVLESIDSFHESLRIKVVLGAANSNVDAVRRHAEASAHEVEVMVGVDNMAPLMHWADAAISAGGTTVWELAYMGVPSALCIIAVNQIHSVGRLARDGVILGIGGSSGFSAEDAMDTLVRLISERSLREKLSARGKQLVDGRGAGRVLAAMLG